MKPLFIFLFKCDLGQKYYALQVQPDRGVNSRPPDHDSTFHVTETPALTTRLSVTPLFHISITHCQNSFRKKILHHCEGIMRRAIVALVESTSPYKTRDPCSIANHMFGAQRNLYHVRLE